MARSVGFSLATAASGPTKLEEESWLSCRWDVEGGRREAARLRYVSPGQGMERQGARPLARQRQDLPFGENLPAASKSRRRKELCLDCTHFGVCSLYFAQYRSNPRNQASQSILAECCQFTTSGMFRGSVA